jgi:hypothetical protein
MMASLKARNTPENAMGLLLGRKRRFPDLTVSALSLVQLAALQLRWKWRKLLSAD